MRKMHFFSLFSLKYLVISKKSSNFAPAFEKEASGLTQIAAIAQLVEHDLAKVGVASSSLVCRSESRTLFLLFYSKNAPEWRNW